MTISREDFLLTNDDYKQLVNSKIKAIVGQQEEILIAFIAKYGCEPNEIEQVEVEHPDGGRTWYVRKRAKTALTIERVKGIIEKEISKLDYEKDYFLRKSRDCPYKIDYGNEIRGRDRDIEFLRYFLRKINEAENE